MHAYIVKTGDGYLYPFADDVSLTDHEDQAGHFLSMDEAHRIAQGRGYREGTYEVLAVEVDERRLIRQ
ncbi:MAG: hypothetical protein ACM3WS_04895 [Bacillota bacterium]